MSSRSRSRHWYNFLVVWAPLILMALWFMFIMRNMQMGGNKAMSFGKSKAKLSERKFQEGNLQRSGRNGRGKG